MEAMNKFEVYCYTKKYRAKSSNIGHLSQNTSAENQNMASCLKCAIMNRGSTGCRKQSPSIALLISAVVIINLCPLQNSNLQPSSHVDETKPLSGALQSRMPLSENGSGQFQQNGLEAWVESVQLLFTRPAQSIRFTSMQAEAKVLGKMAKMWYIKKKIKKISKKLKKHTIAVPVFTAIPIYEHSYYHPQPHIAHVAAPIPMHHHHHAAAASSYAPVVVTQMTAAAAPHRNNQQHVASSSNQQQQVAYPFPTQQIHPRQPSNHHRPHPHPHHIHHAPAIFHPIPAANHIINAYVPAPPLYIDELGGLYGHYANAYGRFDGGYQLW